MSLSTVARGILAFEWHEDRAKHASDLERKASLYKTINNISYLAIPTLVATLALYSQAPFAPLLFKAASIFGFFTILGMEAYESQAAEAIKQAKIARKIADLSLQNVAIGLRSDLNISVDQPLIPDELIVKYHYFKELAQERYQIAPSPYSLIQKLSSKEEHCYTTVFPAALIQAFALNKMKHPESTELTLDQVTFFIAHAFPAKAPSNKQDRYCKVNDVTLSYDQMEQHWRDPFKLRQLIFPEKAKNAEEDPLAGVARLVA